MPRNYFCMKKDTPVPDWYFSQSAVIPFRLKGGDIEILLITSRNGKRWVIPKGVIEQGLTPKDSAIKEALEEAGLQGRIVGGELGRYTYKKWKGICHVVVFAMQTDALADTWEESFRRREWVSPTEAARRVSEPDLRKMIRVLGQQPPQI